MELKLVKPEDVSLEEIRSFRDECLDAGEDEIHGGSLIEMMTAADWVEHVRGNRRAETCQVDWVVEDVFFGVRRTDGRIVGVTSVRHSLDNPILSEYGGNIGYEVRPSERRCGYARQMLQLALDVARERGKDRVMLGCAETNAGSIATIEGAGGVREMRPAFKNGKPMRVYWIEL